MRIFLSHNFVKCHHCAQVHAPRFVIAIREAVREDEH